MKHKAIAAMTLAIIFAAVNPVILIRAAAPPSIIHVNLATEYNVDPAGSEGWGHVMILSVTDQDGLDNLFVNGEISVEILAPDGHVYPMSSDELEVTAWPDADPPHVTILWFNSLSDPPVLGAYEVTVTDRDGLSTTYVTQPTVRVSDTVPTITYPPNFGVILETTPLFTWEAFSLETTGYHLGVIGPETEWASPTLSPDTLQFRFPPYPGGFVRELPRGEAYTLHLFAFEDEHISDSEIRRVTSLRTISFTVFGVNEIYIVEGLLEDLKTAIDDLSVEDFKPIYNIGGMARRWQVVQKSLSLSVERVIKIVGLRGIIGSPTKCVSGALRMMQLIFQEIKRALIDNSTTQQQLLDQTDEIMSILDLYLQIV